MKHFILTLLLLIPFLSIGQMVVEESNKNSADYIIYVTDNRNEADWVIKKTEFRSLAEDGNWFFTKWDSLSDFSIYYTKIRSEADKVVYFTEWDSQIKFN